MSVQNMHPQAKEAFKEGLESILRQWTALELAVVNEWGGSNSSLKAQQLFDELLQQFHNSRQAVYADEVLNYLEEFMELNFNTICEDNSTQELAELLVLMWNECVVGNFTLVTNALTREYVRSEVLQQCQGVDNNGDIDDDDDDDDDVDGGEDGTADAMVDDEEEQTTTAAATTATSISGGQDEWQQVTKTRSKKNSNKR